MTLTKAYDEIVDFIAAGSSPQSVSEFHPSDEAKARVLELMARAKSETIDGGGNFRVGTLSAN